MHGGRPLAWTTSLATTSWVVVQGRAKRNCWLMLSWAFRRCNFEAGSARCGASLCLFAGHAWVRSRNCSGDSLCLVLHSKAEAVSFHVTRSICNLCSLNLFMCQK